MLAPGSIAFLARAVVISSDLRIALTIGGGLLLLALALAAFVFLVAWLEKMPIRKLAPLPPERHGELKPKSLAVLEELRQSGLELLGHFSDGEAGRKEGLISLLLTPQNDVLAQVIHSRLTRRTRLLTRFTDGRWLITADVTGVADLTNTRDEAMLPNSPMPVLLRYHRQLLSERAEATVPFNSETLLDDLFKAEQQRVALMTDAGYASFLDPTRTLYHHTPRGSLAIVTRFLHVISRVDQANKQAKARKQAWEQYHS